MSREDDAINTSQDTDAVDVSRSVPEPGWYPDPYNRMEQRYWDGSIWTVHAADSNGLQIADDPTYHSTSVGGPSNGAVIFQNNVAQTPPSVVILTTKSRGAAFFLTLFFGPIGMLYSTVAGAIIMIVVSAVLVPLTLGFAMFILWPISILWGVLAVHRPVAVVSPQ